MSDTAVTRRSSRKRKLSTRYDDAGIDLDLELDASRNGTPTLDANKSNSEPEYANEDLEDVEDSDDDAEGDAVLIEDIREADDDFVDLLPKAKSSKRSKKPAARQSNQGAEILPRMKSKVTRGLIDIPKRHGRKSRIEHTYGPSNDDLVPFIENRDLWQDDYTLPSCFAPSAYHTAIMREGERADGWNWYTEEQGMSSFNQRQKVQVIDTQRAQHYMSGSGNDTQHFSMGPLLEQKSFTLPSRVSVRLADAWSGKKECKGHVINVGAKVQCLDWLPNNEGTTQFLAISTLPQEPHANLSALGETLKCPLPPAFTAAPSRATCIQIWRVTPATANLDTVLCFDWGDPKQIKWCPMPRSNSDSPPRGLLAGVFFDGNIRVVDINLRSSDGASQAVYAHITGVAFSTTIPQGVLPTCLTWLSTRSIAVGCSNGYVAIFDIATTLTASRGPETTTPRPTLYLPMHPTYILSIASCYPSRPHLILTSSLDGTLRLTDLRAPTLDTVTTLRSRVGTEALAWHDRIQSAISVDDIGVMKAHTLRRFFQSVEVGKVGAQAGALATSPLHSSVLVGGLDGKVHVSNPMRRVTNLKKAEVFRQCWFEYEWRRALARREVDGVAEAMRARQGKDAGPVAAQGKVMEGVVEGLEHLMKPMGRFLDGHKLEQVLGPNVEQTKHSLTHHTIYEEGSAITQLAWNPNVAYGGWAAAGTASGLVRIEDLTLKPHATGKRTRS